jgi:hypothetical protein
MSTTPGCDSLFYMARRRTRTSFSKGNKRSSASIEAQKQTIARLVTEGLWVSQQPEVAAKLRGPNMAKSLPGKKNGRWLPVGTKRLGAGGHYIKVKIAEPNVWEYEHRVVAESKMGRPLRKGEHVHHLNSDKFDNRAENLVVMTHADHSALPNGQNGHARCTICGYRHPAHP